VIRENIQMRIRNDVSKERERERERERKNQYINNTEKNRNNKFEMVWSFNENGEVFS